MAEQKQRKPWQDMAFRELDNKALIEHAKSLGGKKAVEALIYLQQLDAEKIPYKHKVVNRLGQWSGRGTVRGNTGSIGLSSEQMYEYEILVSKKDSSRAHRALEK